MHPYPRGSHRAQALKEHSGQVADAGMRYHSKDPGQCGKKEARALGLAVSPHEVTTR